MWPGDGQNNCSSKARSGKHADLISMDPFLRDRRPDRRACQLGQRHEEFPLCATPRAHACTRGDDTCNLLSMHDTWTAELLTAMLASQSERNGLWTVAAI